MKKKALSVKIGILFLLLLSAVNAVAQVQNIGKIISYKKIAGGIAGKTESAIFDVRVYNENTIRVRVSERKTFNDFSYALQSNTLPVFQKISVCDSAFTINITTSTLIVTIEKKPAFRIIFKNRNGAVINEDVKGDGFGTTFIGDKVCVYKNLQAGERFVGLGEALGNLDRRGTGVTLNNTDTYKYGDPRLPMYSSIPFFIGLHHQLMYGIFFNNSYKTFFNFGLSTPYFSSVTMEGGDVDYFFFYDTSVAKVLEHYTSITGRMPLPPKWSIGYHQSRCSYYPQSKVQLIAETFRQKKIPIDCIVLDADYQDGYKPFKINKARFPDLPALAAQLQAMNIELTASVYPGVKIDSTYESYTDGLKKDVFVKYSNGSLFESEIAPLRCYFPDFTNPKARSWWIEKMKWMPRNGIHGYWNDMNEPAVSGSYLPDNLWFDFDGRKATALEAKNVYGFQMARSSFEAGLANEKNRRPFVLTRSSFAGVQRYAAVWSGDNTASDEGLLSGILLNNQMGLSGLAFVGPDLGGYIGDGTRDLFKRWMEVGVFSPFVRNHKEFFATANEPWSYGEEAEGISKSYIGFRYRLLPYLYSKFYEATQSGMPIARSLCIDYPFDAAVFDLAYQYEFLFGDALLVAPVTSRETSKKLYLPKGDWYDLFTDETVAGSREVMVEIPASKIPVFVKASAIIPMQMLTQSTKEPPGDTLFVHVYHGLLKNTFTLYEDAGDGFEYTQNGFGKRIIEFDPQQKILRFNASEGSYVSPFKKIKLILHGFSNNAKTFVINGTYQQAVVNTTPVFDQLENLVDYYEKAKVQALKAMLQPAQQLSLVFDNTTNAISITWP